MWYNYLVVTIKYSGQLLIDSSRTVRVKFFVDSSSSSTKIAMNVLNQPECNSAYAHPVVVYTEAPEHTRNMEVIFKVS